MKTRRGMLGLASAMLLGLAAPAGATLYAADGLAFENLTEETGRGFGDNWNRYAFSMEAFQGHVYVGTWNVQFDYPAFFGDLVQGNINPGGNPLQGIRYLDSQGAEIWRHDGGQNWTRVLDAPESDTGFRKMVEHNGKLFVASANSQVGTKVYASTDGSTWTPVAGGPTAVPENNSIRTMVTYDGKLYVGTENNIGGAELWAYDDSLDAWEKKATFSQDSSVSELLVREGHLYVGTWDFTDSFNLYAGDGSNFQMVTPPTSSPGNVGVMKLVEFKGQVYLGTVNYQNGFTLLRTSDPSDPQSWQVVTTDGLGDRNNAYSWSIVEYDGKLYLGTFNDGLYGGVLDPLPVPLDGRAQLWCSEDGLSWERVVDDGFGSKFTYGIRNMLVEDGRLWIGTASNFFIPDPWSYLDDEALAGFGFMDLDEFDRSWLEEGRIEDLLAFFHSCDFSIGTEIWRSQPVPEPGTLLLLGTGIVGLAARRRMNR